jgi:hypothetical protein
MFCWIVGNVSAVRWPKGFTYMHSHVAAHLAERNEYVEYMVKHNLIYMVCSNVGSRVGAVVEALSYKPEGRGFNSRWCHWNFSLTNSGRSMALGSTQPLTEMSTRYISWAGA